LTALAAGLFTLQLGIAPAHAFLGFKLGSVGNNPSLVRANETLKTAGSQGRQGRRRYGAGRRAAG